MAFSYFTFLQSPLGKIVLTATSSHVLTGVFLPGNTRYEEAQRGTITSNVLSCFENVIVQLEEYFDGKRQGFAIAREIIDVTFSEKVLNATCTIQYGQTTTYQAIAKNLHNPDAARAVGNALARNNFSIIIPCHRVLNSRGLLNGYNGGLRAKGWLLQHEQRYRVTPAPQADLVNSKINTLTEEK